MKNQTIISLLCCLLLFVTGCSISHQGNTYDIMTYGAKGDGQTDDAAAINAPSMPVPLPVAEP